MFRSSGLQHHVVLQQGTNVLEDLAVSNLITLKMEATKSFETLESYCNTTRHRDLKDDLNLHHHENSQISHINLYRPCVTHL